jgi:hypothetical protein
LELYLETIHYYVNSPLALKSCAGVH